MPQSDSSSDSATLYCVITAPQNGGHGPWPAVILIDPDPVRAIETARLVEELGYRINWDSQDVRVDRMVVGSVMTRAQSKIASGVIYKKRWGRTDVNRPLEFLEHVYDADVATKLKMTVSWDWEPSLPIAQ